MNDHIFPYRRRFMGSVASALAIAVIVGCVSTTTQQASADSASWTGRYTIVGESNKPCSVGTVGKPRTESILTTIAAPILASIAKTGINAIGNAFRKAGEEKERAYETNRAPITLAVLESPKKISNDNTYALNVTYEPKCVRFAVAKMSHSSFGSPKAEHVINATNLTNVEGIKSEVTQYLNGELRDNVEDVYLYGEYLIAPNQNDAGETFFEIAPKFIWYNKSISGSRFTLAGINLKLLVPGGSDGDDASLAYLHSFAPDSLKPNSFRSDGLSTIPTSGLLPAPNISAAETKVVERLQEQLEAVNKIVRVNPPPQSEPYLTLISRRDSLRDERRSIDRDLCLEKASPGSVRRCEIDLEAEDVVAVITDLEMKQDARTDFARVKSAVEGIKGLGYYNAQFEIMESRAANQFYLAVADALKDTEEDRGKAIDQYVSKRLGLIEKDSNIANEGAYLLAKFDHDKAIESLSAAKDSGDQEAIEKAQRTAIEKFNAVREAAEKAGITFSGNPPY